MKKVLACLFGPCWPIFIEVFLQLLVGNIDQLMMSHYSPQAVAAVANANQILNILSCPSLL